MYLRVTRGRFDPARYDEALPVARDISEAVKQMAGNAGIVQGMSRATGALVAVSTWDTEEHAGWSRDALGELGDRLRALGVLLEPPEVYEVTVQ